MYVRSIHCYNKSLQTAHLASSPPCHCWMLNTRVHVVKAVHTASVYAFASLLALMNLDGAKLPPTHQQFPCTFIYQGPAWANLHTVANCFCACHPSQTIWMHEVWTMLQCLNRRQHTAHRQASHDFFSPGLQPGAHSYLARLSPLAVITHNAIDDKPVKLLDCMHAGASSRRDAQLSSLSSGGFEVQGQSIGPVASTQHGIPPEHGLAHSMQP